MSPEENSELIEADDAESPAGAEIICGDWWDDNWISPYLRARFQSPREETRLIVRAFNPACTRQKNRLLIRVGTEILLQTDIVALDGWVEIDQPLPESYLQDDVCDISLRSLKSWSPQGGDTRLMGFILVDWRLET